MTKTGKRQSGSLGRGQSVPYMKNEQRIISKRGRRNGTGEMESEDARRLAEGPGVYETIPERTRSTTRG